MLGIRAGGAWIVAAPEEGIDDEIHPAQIEMVGRIVVIMQVWLLRQLALELNPQDAPDLTAGVTVGEDMKFAIGIVE
jgi:hypothetical protein